MSKHNTEVQQRRGFGRTIYEAVCSCGWLSKPCLTEPEADLEATDHVVAATRGEP